MVELIQNPQATAPGNIIMRNIIAIAHLAQKNPENRKSGETISPELHPSRKEGGKRGGATGIFNVYPSKRGPDGYTTPGDTSSQKDRPAQIASDQRKDARTHRTEGIKRRKNARSGHHMSSTPHGAASPVRFQRRKQKPSIRTT